MRSVTHRFLQDAASLSEALVQTGTMLRLQPFGPEAECYQFAGQLRLNTTPLLSYSGAGVHCEVEPLPEVMIAACYFGRRHVKDPQGEVLSAPGGGVLMPVGDGARTYSSPQGASAVAVNLEPTAIHRVAAAISGNTQEAGPVPRCFTHFPLWALTPLQARPLHSLLRHIDDAACMDSLLPTRLGLDDVIARLVAMWLHPPLLEEQRSDRRRLQERQGRTAFDDLIDYIRANLDQPLRLSDLETRSFYSRRALQYAFQEKFGLTPMQWIREQRLARAMEQLQGSCVTSVRAVALACGYRNPSQFSSDFRRRFGRSPSQVWRKTL